MTHFILTHGAWHDAWCWAPLIHVLEDRGQTATAVQLPSDEVGQGAEAYAAAIAAAVQPTGSVVVGHSLAGLAIPLVPALAPVNGLIFLAALLPELGTSWRDQLKAGRPMAPWWYDNGLPRQLKDSDGRSLWPSDVAIDLFFHDCEPGMAAASAVRLRPQAPTPVIEPTPLHEFPDVPTAYVMGRDDRVVSADWVRATSTSRLGVEPTWIDGGHSPFLARPTTLAELFIHLADLEFTSTQRKSSPKLSHRPGT